MQKHIPVFRKLILSNIIMFQANEWKGVTWKKYF